MPAPAHTTRYPHILHPPGPGRPAKSTAAKVAAVVFSPVGIATGAALLLAVVAIRSSGRADAAEQLVRDLMGRGPK